MTAPPVPRLRLEALQGARAGPFDLSLDAGEALAVTGASGAGKSLFLRMIADLDPNSGEAWLDGAARSGMTAPAWRRQVSYCAAESGAAESGWWHDTVGPHFDRPVQDLLDRLGLRADILAARVRVCSTGERQRLALIRVLARTPPVLLLDEPTGALDAHSVARVETLLRERLAAGDAIVIVTHDPAQAARLGTQQAVMRDGRLHFS